MTKELILCSGELLIDLVPVRSPEGPALLPCPGGAARNSAVALARLGNQVALQAGISEDAFGQRLREDLVAEGVRTDALVTRPGPTALAIAHPRPDGVIYSFHEEGSAGRGLEAAELQVFPAVLHLFGGISLVHGPCADAHETACLRAARSTLVMVDPNIRPGLVRDEAGYRARLMRMMAEADIIKLSDEDLDWLAPGTDGRDLIAGLLAGRCRILCLTRGAAGASLHGQDLMLHCPAPQVDVVDTVGAGDTFNAGLLTSLRENGLLGVDLLDSATADDLLAALQMAVRAASLSVTRPGADPPMRHQLD